MRTLAVFSYHESPLTPMQQIALFGATGSIGQSTLQVVDQHPSRFAIFALIANSHITKMQELCLKYQPRYAVMCDSRAADELRLLLAEQASTTTVLSGAQGLLDIAAAPEVDIMVMAIVGVIGLEASMVAAHAGKRILLASKEILVMAGQLFMQAVQTGKATLLPIDSEHNAIFQVMPTHNGHHQSLDTMGVRRILLTASGGPFRQTNWQALQSVTPEQALQHPNWRMGKKNYHRFRHTDE